MPAHCCFKWLINSDMALKVKDVKDSKIIKLVVLIMGGGSVDLQAEKKEGVSKQSNWHILFLFCFVFQKSFKPPILD